MATSDALRRKPIAVESAALPVGTSFTLTDALTVLASLRLTVVLFALTIFLVFAGTLAQVDHGVWDVVNHSYFRVWFAWIEFRALERLIQLFAKGTELNWHGGFPFPGGLLLGSLLMLNLIAAHAVRFKIAASGTRLYSGLALIAAGIIVTALAISSGMNDTIESELSPAFCDGLWQGLRAGLAAVALFGVYLLALRYGRSRPVEWWLLAAVVLPVAAMVVWLFLNPSWRLDDSGLRILWQLVKGLAAGIVLLVGCVLVFRQRAGVVLLHGGVALLMCSELWTGITANEAQMAIAEGQTANYARDIRTTELAFVDHSDPKTDRVVVVPASLLSRNVTTTSLIEDDRLPFNLKVLSWLDNSTLRAPKEGESNPATAGSGMQLVAEKLGVETGVDVKQSVDFPAAYIELYSKADGKSLGTYLFGPELSPQSVTASDKPFDVALRHKRINFPYTLTLIDFRHDKYTGTSQPKNFSSLVRLEDPEHNVDREVPIWMNNPLRYAGTTFYQAGWDEKTEAGTVLQVVKNPGWMAPYVACMLVMTGMLAHFGVSLTRFLNRGVQQASERLSGATSGYGSLLAIIVPAVIVAIFGLYVVSKARMPKNTASEMQIYEFGKLPLAYQGRVKPYDTVARNALQILSGRQEVIGKAKSGWLNKLMRRAEKTPAIVWLLDSITDSPASLNHRIFRIENLELLEAVGLEPREGSWRYSLADIRDHYPEVEKQIQLASAVPEAERSRFQRAAIALADNLSRYAALVKSFRTPAISTDRDQLAASLQQVQADIQSLYQGQAPQAVPPVTPTGQWTPLMEAEFQLIQDHAMKRDINPTTMPLSMTLDAYAKGDVASFNKHLAEYRAAVRQYEDSLEANAAEVRSAGLKPAEILQQGRINFEVFFNQFSPFYYAAVLYVFAFIVGVLSWLGWRVPLHRTSIALVCLALIVHSFALWARMEISGRPPVTNLYSSAIFIGWAGVLLCLIFEWVFGLGLANIVAAVAGFLTLIIAHYLSLDGDTFIVMQAVLDTQFWLSTHVVCISLGYVATYLAGLFGITYLVVGQFIPVLNDQEQKIATRMIYGTLCFAIYFSFIGTVLGGLWADDSWGRFWGWDPKENGALIIVLYNALVLHARWGGLVGPRGLALLAIGGNIVTTWSWFGVNELGVGLHSYGASESSTAMWLLAFAASQAAIIAIGMLPPQVFRGSRSAAT
jgi:ABC-type transport system involved in cytochrome c biogenesis permease subunit